LGSFPTQNPHHKHQKLTKIDAINVLLRTISVMGRERQRGGKDSQSYKTQNPRKGVHEKSLE